MDTLRKKETLLYVFLWVVVFAIVALSMRDLNAAAFQLLPFLVLFLAHNYSLTPLLFRRKRVQYLILTAILFGVFVFYCFRTGERPPEMDPWLPDRPGPGGPPKRILSPEVVKLLLGFLVLLVNLGVKSFFVALRRGQEIAALQARSRIHKTEEPEEAPSVLHFKTDYKTVPVKLAEIRYVESMSEYVKVYLDGQPQPLVVLYSLKKLVEQLPAGRFMRIHRSYIIALSYITEASRSEVVLDNDTRLPVGEVYRPAFREYLASKAKK
jgi:hypothetical protein